MDKQQIHDKLQAVAALLGGTFAPNDHDAALVSGYITLASGSSFYAKAGGYNFKDRLGFSPKWPSYVGADAYTKHISQRDFMPYNSPFWDGITVADSKTPEQIAKDLQRRFIPTFEEMHAKAVAYCEEHTAYYRDRAATQQRFNEILKPVSGVYASNYSRHTARFDFDLTPEQLEKVLVILGK